MSAVYTPLFDKVDVHSYIYIQRVLAYTFSRHVSPTNLRFSFGSCRFRCIIFVLLLTCLAAFALTLLVCLFACRRKRNDRTRRGPMQRGATLPLPSRWPPTKGCSNTCGQPHWAPPPPTPYSWWWLCMRLQRSLPRSAGRSAARCSRCSEPCGASARHHGVPPTTRTSAGAPRHARRGTP